jgi:hypothetical protein
MILLVAARGGSKTPEIFNKLLCNFAFVVI